MSFLWCARGSGRVRHSDSLPHNQDQKENGASQQETCNCVEIVAPMDSPHSMVALHPDPSHYQLLTLIGKACNDTASVFLARHVPSGSYVAIKLIHLEQCPIDFTLLQHEILMQRLNQHHNVQHCLCSFVSNNDVWVVMNLMAYGSCRDLIHAHFVEGLPEMAIALILREVLQAVDYLHQRGIIHRSIRASHVLVSASGHVTLTGFRHSVSMMHAGKRLRVIHDFPNYYERSLNWASPELLEQNLAGYDTKSDIYSIGIAACELANGLVPFSNVPVTQMLLEKLDGITPQLMDTNTLPEFHLDDPPIMQATQTDSGVGDSEATNTESIQRLPYQRAFSPAFHQFVHLCLQADSRDRPTAATLLQHNFLKQVKRKSALELLPSLLQPVQALTETDMFIKGEFQLDNVVDELRELSVNETDWDF